MLKFQTAWNDEIAAISSDPEFQRAVIRIDDPSLLSKEYDVDTAQWTITGDSKVYEGQARVIGVRWGVFNGGESQANATTLAAVRLQIPQRATGRIKRGLKVRILSAPNPVLSEYLLVITSDFQGSSDASRTFECGLDMDVQVTP